MSRVAIRAATKADADTLAEMIAELLALHETPVPDGLADALRRDGFGDRPRFEALIADLDGQAVGMTLFYPTYRPSLTRPGLLMEDLFVRAPARRLGVARKLTARLAALARARGCGYIEWAVERENHAGRRFYESAGGTMREGSLTYQLGGAALDRLAEEG